MRGPWRCVGCAWATHAGAGPTPGRGRGPWPLLGIMGASVGCGCRGVGRPPAILNVKRQRLDHPVTMQECVCLTRLCRMLGAFSSCGTPLGAHGQRHIENCCDRRRKLDFRRHRARVFPGPACDRDRRGLDQRRVLDPESSAHLFLDGRPPAALVGVGFSVSASLLFGTSALSMGVFGALAVHLGPRPVFWLSAVFLSVVFIAGAIGYARIVQSPERPPKLPESAAVLRL